MVSGLIVESRNQRETSNYISILAGHMRGSRRFIWTISLEARAHPAWLFPPPRSKTAKINPAETECLSLIAVWQVRGCVPRAEIKELPSRFKAIAKWDANHKLGPAVAVRAMKRAIELADEFGTGTVCVDNAFHYLWGGTSPTILPTVDSRAFGY